MKKYLNSTFLLLIFAAAIFISSSGGRDDRRAGAPGDPGGCSCHGPNVSSSAVLTGVPAVITLGQTYSLTLTVTDPGANYNGAGFQIAASSGVSFPTNVGTFIPGPGTRVNPIDRLVHSTPQNYIGNQAIWNFDWKAHTSNDYSEVTFFFGINSADLTGGTGGDNGFLGNSVNITVPLDWAYFEVESNVGSHVLSWGTHMENMTDYFEIQISQDGREFRTIGQVDAAIYSETDLHYSFFYSSSFVKSFYRIKQIDLDGKFSFSEVRELIRRDVEVNIYPTLVNDYINIEMKDLSGKTLVYDMVGNLVNSSDTDKILQVGDLSSGTYVLMLVSDVNEPIVSRKFVKL